jgi:hypothetical protein
MIRRTESSSARADSRGRLSLHGVITNFFYDTLAKLLDSYGLADSDSSESAQIPA